MKKYKIIFALVVGIVVCNCGAAPNECYYDLPTCSESFSQTYSESLNEENNSVTFNLSKYLQKQLNDGEVKIYVTEATFKPVILIYCNDELLVESGVAAATQFDNGLWSTELTLDPNTISGCIVKIQAVDDAQTGSYDMTLSQSSCVTYIDAPANCE